VISGVYLPQWKIYCNKTVNFKKLVMCNNYCRHTVTGKHTVWKSIADSWLAGSIYPIEKFIFQKNQKFQKCWRTAPIPKPGGGTTKFMTPYVKRKLLSKHGNHKIGRRFPEIQGAKIHHQKIRRIGQVSTTSGRGGTGGTAPRPEIWRVVGLVPPDRDLIACRYRQLVPPPPKKKKLLTPTYGQHTSYQSLYDELTTREGKTKIYKLAKSRNRATQESTTLQPSKTKTTGYFGIHNWYCNAGRGTSNKSQMKNFPILQYRTIPQYPDQYQKYRRKKSHQQFSRWKIARQQDQTIYRLKFGRKWDQ